MSTTEGRINLAKRLGQDMRLRLSIALFGVIVLSILAIIGMNISYYSVLVLIVVIAVMFITFKIFMIKKKNLNLLKYIFITVDILLIAYLMTQTGGIHSPLYLLYVVIILYEGLNLGKRKFVIYLIILVLIADPVSIICVNYEKVGLSIEFSDIIIFLIKYVFIFMFGFLTLLFEKKLLAQRVELKNALSGNINLSVKLKKFNQELIDRVLTATNSLENEAALNMELYKKTQKLFMSTTKALISAIDAKDPYTYGHTERMAIVSLAIFDELCEEISLPNRDKLRETLELASLLHDIGKIGIHDKVLLKPGPLNEKEWEEIKKHPIIGSNILESIEELDEVGEIIDHHHEKYDGTGYISGLKGEKIPLLSRIISIADSYDAMTSSRPYRKKMKSAVALEEIERNSGTQFDPKLVKAFKEAFSKGKIS